MKLSALFLLACLLTALPLRAADAAASTGLGAEEIRSCYTNSYRYEKSQSYADAIKAIAPVLRAYPQTYTVNLRLGYLYYLSGNYANSVQCYDVAIKAAPKSLEPLLGKLLPLLAQQRYSDAEELANQVLIKDPANYYANLRLAYALRYQKKFDQAVDICNRMLPLYPSDISFLTEMGCAKWGLNDLAGATPYFAHVQDLDPENAMAKVYFTPVAKAGGAGATTKPAASGWDK